MAWCELESSIIFNLQWYIVYWYIPRCNTKTDLPMISAIVVKNYSEMDVLLSYLWSLVGSINYTLIADALPALTQQHWSNMAANARILINSLRPSVTHIHVSKLTIIGPDNDLSPGRCQAIIWTKDGILLIGSMGKNFIEIVPEIYIHSLKKNAVENVVWNMVAIFPGFNVLKASLNTYLLCI